MAETEAQLQRACAAHREGRLGEAEGLYREVLEADPGRPDALHLLGLARFQQGDPGEALELIEEAVGRRPDQPDYLFNLGKILRALGRPRDALAAFDRARSLAPGDPAVSLGLGNCLRQLDRPEAAEAAYREALELDPKMVAAHNNLGSLQRSQGQLEKAAESYRAALALAPRAAEIWENLAKTLTDAQDRAGALAAYREALAIDPARENAHHMADALAGAPSEAPPDGYVRGLFDDYAGRFEGHVTSLGYGVPAAFRKLLDRLHPPESGRLGRALDLGCGTGLVGTALRPRVERLEGLDISPRMLEKARAKRVYDDLQEAGLKDFLGKAPAAAWDLVLAADVFIYVGALEEVIPAIRRVLAPGGLLLCSLELPSEGEKLPEGFRLQPSGRYAHEAAYGERLAREAGLDVVLSERSTLRRDGQRVLEAQILALQAP